MKRFFSFLVTVAVSVMCCASPAKAYAQNERFIVEDGRSDYKIVIAWDASGPVRHAAEELQYFIQEMSGAKLPIIEDGEPFHEKEIIVGGNVHLNRLATYLSVPGPEGFIIKTHGPHLLIIGGGRGVHYGVYTFLEKYLGCRWYSDTVSKIPKMETIAVGEIDDRQVPTFEYRELHFHHAMDTAGSGDWCIRNKINGNFHRLDEMRGGKVRTVPFCHTFNAILSPEEHFDEHPGYFSMRDGKRVGGRTQLCLTNPDVLSITIQTVRRWIKENPDAKIFSVTQNDWGNWCECPNCKAIDEAEESHSGTMIAFVNKVAEAIEKDYPDVLIDTFAYQYTRKPPKTIVPRKNVVVRLCSIECCFTEPFVTSTYAQNVSFRDDIKGWAAKTDRIYVWDYVTNFTHYVMPHPNLEVLQPNVQFLAKHNVKGVFEQGSAGHWGGAANCGEFAELRAYMLAKLLWNPDVNIQEVMDDFLEGYYGNAAPFVKSYITTLHQRVKDQKYQKGCYGDPEASFYTDEFLDTCLGIFAEAKKAELSAGELRRVEIAELPIIYVKMLLAPKEKLDRALVDHFFRIAEEEQIERVAEARLMRDYRAKMMEKLKE